MGGLHEKKDPLRLENIKTLSEIEASQRSVTKEIGDSLLFAGIVSLFTGASKILSSWFSSPEEKTFRRAEKVGKGLSEANEAMKKHGLGGSKFNAEYYRNKRRG